MKKTLMSKRSIQEGSTPAALGYAMPAEWAQHEATWIAWPHQREDWPGKFAPIPWVYVEIVRLLQASEPVAIVAPYPRAAPRIRERLELAGIDAGRVRFRFAATERSWLRDTGPSFVTRQGSEPVAAVCWRFNGWARYRNHAQDARLAGRIAAWAAVPQYQAEAAGTRPPRRIVMEGGAIDVNGRGTLLTTEECLLSPIQARNPGLDRPAIERVFADYLGTRRVIWLGQGIAGDDTHGHVDDIARFVADRTVVTVIEPRRGDPNHEPLADNLRRLRDARDQDGRKLTVVTLPMPRPVVFAGQRLPASYANFYIANRVVLVPTFNDPADRTALQTLADLFPDRAVVGVHAVDLVLGLGTLHCLTQQQPAAPEPS